MRWLILNEEFSPKAIGMGVYVAGTALGGFLGRVIIGGLTDLL
ncbi:hypothetical protein ABNF65_11215 [Paenibacillus larvae]|nr:hypothetical protein [Paenibacillus larvae]